MRHPAAYAAPGASWGYCSSDAARWADGRPLADVVLGAAKDEGLFGEIAVLNADPSTAAVETCLPHHRWVRHRGPCDWGSTLANIVPNDAWRSEKDAQVGFAALQREAL